MKFLTKAIFVTVLGAGSALLYADNKPDEVVNTKDLLSIQRSIWADHQTMSRLQAKAREDKDPIRLNCINDKVVLLNGHMRIADDLFSSPVQTEASMAALRDKAKDIREVTEDAKACVDSKRLATETNNSFSTDGHIPTVTDDDGGHDLENPGYASPDD
ncbi:MAG: hypothetical protein NT062_09275 [Proteobacteria bacterium]|nr:hypothetical protein [Pseudomonadota bacterium]